MAQDMAHILIARRKTHKECEGKLSNTEMIKASASISLAHPELKIKAPSLLGTYNPRWLPEDNCGL